MEDQNCPGYEPLNVPDQFLSNERLPHFGQVGAIALAMAINLTWSKSRVDRICGGIKLVMAACLFVLVSQVDWTI